MGNKSQMDSRYIFFLRGSLVCEQKKYSDYDCVRLLILKVKFDDFFLNLYKINTILMELRESSIQKIVILKV